MIDGHYHCHVVMSMGKTASSWICICWMCVRNKDSLQGSEKLPERGSLAQTTTRPAVSQTIRQPRNKRPFSDPAVDSPAPAKEPCTLEDWDE